MKYIKKIKLVNFKRFESFEYIAREKRNIFIGDNEAGKSTILQAIDLVLTGSRSRIEIIGLETLFHQKIVTEFLKGDKKLTDLPHMVIEIYLNDYGELLLDGKNNSDEVVCHGVKLACEPMIEEYSQEIECALEHEGALFPFEYYNIQFSTFAGQLYTQNRRFLNHILIDSSLIGTEYATRQYTKSLYEANTSLVERHKNNHAYRHSKANFTVESLVQLNAALDKTQFDVKSDGKSNLEQDLMITQEGIPVAQMGKGKQCFIKTEFALQQRKGAKPIDLILIEEPENHLSHLNMRKLINEIEEATQTQIFIATHSNSVCSRLDLHNASLISPLENISISLSDLPDDTANFFIKAPNNKILEFILSKKVLLVEGDAEYMLIDGMYENTYREKTEDANIHIISVGGTSFKRYLDLANLLKIKTAVIRDNDGKHQENCIDNYADYTGDLVQVFSDENDTDRTTLEKCIYQDNEALCEELLSPGRKTLSVEEYMLSNKADAALKILEQGMDRLVAPKYIGNAFEWIRR
ncbi:ATP-dependent nuclease [Marinobacterium sedimentorum]|uniref:ATP-dependent nuclease n=1 Tax=Marinobacterium sedimentorum TaxID=2927804 RepID=UPI0020C5D6DE|nr:TOPRIM nucleotidyl transferase/hydrolase domain-containing protein [Marinobacterium sedimentorum]MCP8685936.1 AAA family ATPase [Marinobacterium sedimentorum]